MLKNFLWQKEKQKNYDRDIIIKNFINNIKLEFLENSNFENFFIKL